MGIVAVDSSRTIREILTEHPEARAVLLGFGLDACCGALLPLEEACRRHDLRLDEVRRAVETAVTAARSPDSSRAHQASLPLLESARRRIDPTSNIRQLIADHPDVASVLERVGLMGCGGAAGPDEPLDFFAKVHRVPLEPLLAELEAAVAPSHPPAPTHRARASSTGTPVPTPTDSSRRFVPFFVASLLLTLTLGATLGMINLARLTSTFGSLPRPSVWAHGYVQVFGFVGLFVMGVAYHVMPRFVGAPLRSPHLVRWTLGLQVAGVVTVALGLLWLGSRFTQALWIAGSVAILAGASCFTVSIARTLAAGRAGPERFGPWVLAGCGWLMAGSGLAVLAGITGETTWHHVLWPAALFGFAGSWILGVGRRIFPVFLGWEPRWLPLERPNFVLYQCGVAAWSAGAWPELDNPILTLLRAAGAVSLMIAIALYARIVGLIGPRQPMPPTLDRGHERFIYSAWIWLGVGLALGPLYTLVALSRGEYGSITILDFSRHAVAFGFVTQMMIGVASRVLPVFTGNALWSPALRAWTFWLLNAAVAIRGLQVLVAAGYWPGAWPWIALAGPPGVGAVLLFTINVMMTMRGGGARRARAVTPDGVADALVADLLAVPGTLALLLEAGFTPLRNPVLRATFAGTVTLREACRMRGVALDPLVARLKPLVPGSGPATTAQ